MNEFTYKKHNKNFSIIEYSDKLNNLCINLSKNKKEIVDIVTMENAKEIVNTLVPKNSIDVILYCASLNVLNTYIKQKNSNITYQFKYKVLNNLVKSIIDNNIENCTFYLTSDRSMSVVYIKISKLLFSFHQIYAEKEIINKIKNSSKNKPIIFDNIRKQNCAYSLFNNVCNLYFNINNTKLVLS